MHETLQIVDDDQTGVGELVTESFEEWESPTLIGNADEENVHFVTARLSLPKSFAGTSLVVLIAVTIGDMQDDGTFSTTEVLEVFFEHIAVVSSAAPAGHFPDDMFGDVVAVVVFIECTDTVGVARAIAESEHIELMVWVKDHSPGREPSKEGLSQTVEMFVFETAADVEVECDFSRRWCLNASLAQ